MFLRRIISQLPPAPLRFEMQAAGGGGGGGGAGATVPRNFKLLDELDEAERSTKGGADVSLGLAQTDDNTLSYWNCSIFAQAGGGEPRMWSLSLHCDKDYPSKPPTLKFSSKIVMDCVDAKGNVSAPAERARARTCSGCGRHARWRGDDERRGAARRNARGGACLRPRGAVRVLARMARCACSRVRRGARADVRATRPARAFARAHSQARVCAPAHSRSRSCPRTR